MKRVMVLVVLVLGLGSAAVPAQAKLVTKPACVQKSLPAHLRLQVGYCTQ